MNTTKGKKKSSLRQSQPRENEVKIFRDVEASVLHILSSNKSYFDTFDKKFLSLKKKFGNEIYPTFLYLIANLEFDEKEAIEHYNSIKKHHQKMSSLLKRDVDIRVAVADYFVSNKKMIKDPVILEIHLFKKTYEAGVTDNLTSLYNYAFLKGALPHEIANSKRYVEPLSVIFFDLDDFKEINDKIGHERANLFLKHFAGIIKNSIREMDLPFRYGGEEFVLVLPKTDKFGALAVAERIRKSYKEFSSEKEGITASVSGGIASYPVDDDRAQNLIRKADEAMYRAKARGKNTIELYNTERRRFERFMDNFRGVVTLDGKQYEIYGKNVSASGFYFETEKPILQSKKIDFSIEFENLRKSSGSAIVTRVEPHPEGKHGVGVAITTISRSDKNLLLNHIKSLKTKSR